MAVLSNVNVVRVWTDGLSDKVALFALRNVTTGDTIDLSPDFLIPMQAVLLGTTVIGTEAASIAGSVLTIPAGLSHAAGYLLVWGVSA